MNNMLCNFIKVVFSSSLMIISTVPYVICVICWAIISTFLPGTWFHKVEDPLWGWYQRMVVFLFEHMTGVEVYIDGTIPCTKENVLVLSNHQCMVDWIVADFLAIRQNMTGNMRFVFKNSLKYYPIYGFSFGLHGGVFVRRDGFYNNTNMERVIHALQQKKADIYFLLYPEGTRFTPHKQSLLEKSQSFAVNCGLEPLKQVLTPRVKAFDCALNSMKSYVDAVYDITIIYDTREPEYDGYRPQAPHAAKFLMGCCKRIYIKIDRIPIGDVLKQMSLLSNHDSSANETSASMKWLHNRFLLKDEILDAFFSKGSYDTSSKIWKRSYLPLSATLPSLLSFIFINAFFLYFPLGRYIYFFTSTVGVLLMCLYAHIYF